MSNISKLIAEKTGYPDLLNDLIEKLSGSELNTLLLELFRKKAGKITPAAVLKQFRANRFVAPSVVDPISFRELEIRYLKLAEKKGFKLVTLSPLTCLGTCSAMGFVDQNNVVSALRGTEVVSDATNVFAILIADEFKKQKKNSVLKYATAQRHVRSQFITAPGLTPHFSIFCMATGGVDTGGFTFEVDNLLDHIHLHFLLFSEDFGSDQLILKIFLKDDNEIFHSKLEDILQGLKGSLKIDIEKQPVAGDYYKLIRFRFFVEHRQRQVNLSDGGFVDWTQKLISNRKHRLIISGIGTELIHKLKSGQL